VEATSLCTPSHHQSYLQKPAGRLLLLLLNQDTGTHQGHMFIVQQVQTELAGQNSCHQRLHLGEIILEVPAQPACESHQLCWR
jgi:hypothetical protein